MLEPADLFAQEKLCRQSLHQRASPRKLQAHFVTLILCEVPRKAARSNHTPCKYLKTWISACFHKRDNRRSCSQVSVEICIVSHITITAIGKSSLSGFQMTKRQCSVNGWQSKSPLHLF
ncbi:Hypothetical predicted protein [Podarcis lilfordi]|uniref:Uncharacterized protein n=1 Tax=Podarcis lilfordi TaxID=74358 RepID=A0AA35LK41_9SAUR|nr:Hypothetical predicted protein [Podarcis lilfordi]